jgi:hypothetical protein
MSGRCNLQMKVVLIELSGCPQSVHVEDFDPSAAQIDQARLLQLRQLRATGSSPGPVIGQSRSVAVIAAIPADFPAQGERPSNPAIGRADRCSAMPRDISSRSESVSANRERRRGTGRIPPCGDTWK